MTHLYEKGAIRWKRWPISAGDPRGYKPKKGWDASADILNFHPITGKPFPRDNCEQWWIREEFRGSA